MDAGFCGNGRLFLGAVPDADARAKIDRLSRILKRSHRFDGASIKPECLHVSLLGLGRLGLGSPSEDLVRTGHEAAAAVRMARFDVTFDRTVSFRGKSGQLPFVLIAGDGWSALQSLRQQLVEALRRKAMKGVARRAFTPHVTLWYGESGIAECPIEPIGWTVREFVLIHSLHGHTCLARWPLGV
jgi:2'-5' RNA ligase